MLIFNWQILWTFLNLIIFYLLLKKFLFRPVTAMMEQRAGQVQESLLHAKNARADAESLKNQYQDHLKQAQQESAQLIVQAREEASRQAEEILRQAHQDAEHILQNAAQETIRDREQAMEDLQAGLSEIILLAAAKVSQKNMDEETNKELVEQFLSQVGDLK